MSLCFSQAYIDFEIGEGERERVRLLYTRLLDRTKHVKVGACVLAVCVGCVLRVGGREYSCCTRDCWTAPPSTSGWGHVLINGVLGVR